jgi:hypothetical protein
MRRQLAGLTVLATLTIATPALAAHTPSSSEQQQIKSTVRAFLVKSGSPAAKKAVINGIKVSDKNSSWAIADISAPMADDAVVALRKTGGHWKALNLGTSHVQCGIGMPKSVMQELFHSTNCSG